MKIIKIIIGILVICIFLGILGSKNDGSENKNIVKNEVVSIPAMSSSDSIAYAVKTCVNKNFVDENIEYINPSKLMKLSNGMWMQKVEIKQSNGEIEKFGFIISGEGFDADVEAMDIESNITNILIRDNLEVVGTYDTKGNKIN